MSTLTAVLAASLLGSMHCAAMCGGFVALYAGQRHRGPAVHIAYNLGRLVSYTTLGTAAGFLAGRFDAALAALVGIQRAAGWLLGAVMILVALRELGWLRRRAVVGIEDRRRGPLRRLRARIGRATAAPGLAPAALVGLLSAALPCAWLWGFVALAGVTGSAAGGAAVMATFWVGTVPLLLALGGVIERLGLRARRIGARLTAVALLAAGVFALSGRLMPAAAPDQPLECHVPAAHEAAP